MLSPTILAEARGADRAVRAEPDEDGLIDVRRELELPVRLDGQVRHVVVDPHRRVAARRRHAELVKHPLYHAGRELLAGEPVADADHLGAPDLVQLGDRGRDVEVERLANRAGLLRAVENGDRPDARGERRDKLGSREGPEEPDRDEADLLATAHELLDGLSDCSGPRAHHDDNSIRRKITLVIDEVVAAPRPLGELVHDSCHDPGYGRVEAVGRLS